MFDLFRSRAKNTRYLLGALLMLVALSMVITLIPGFDGMSMGTTDQVIAEIGDDDQVTLREVQMSLNDTMRGRSIPPELVSVYAPQIVDQVVKERAIAYYAKELGYKVTDEDVAQVIKMMVPQLFEGGQFVGKEAYQQFLQANNTSIAEFEAQARMRASLRRLESMVLEGMVVTPAEIEREFRARNERVTLEYIKIDPEKLKAEIKITPDEVNANWAVSKSAYRIPEKRTARVLMIDEAKASAGIQMDEAQLRRYYENNKDQFRTQERVRARHILVKTMDKPGQEDALKKKAEDLLKQIKSGSDFAELAKKNSDDTVSAAKGGDLDWFTRGQMVKAFEDSAFSMKAGQTSDLVKTEFGYHIIQTQEKQEAKLQPFEEVKATIQQEQAKEKVYDRMAELADQARAALVKDPASAEQVAQQLGMHLIKVENQQRGGVYPVVNEAAVDLDDAIFELAKPGDVSQVVQLPKSQLAVAVLDSVQQPRQAELNEVEDQIRNSLRSERVQRLLTERATQVMDRVRANGGDLRKAAAGMPGVEVKKTPEFGKEGQAEGIGAANYLDEAFRRDVGSVFGPVNVSGANFICKVVAKTPADMSRLAEQRFDILLRLKSQKAQQRRDLFEDGLLQHLKDKGVVKIHQDTVKRLVDSYKSS